jgi:hypothetical protein
MRIERFEVAILQNRLQQVVILYVRDHYNCAGVVARNNFSFQHSRAKLAHNEVRSIAKSFRLVEVA